MKEREWQPMRVGVTITTTVEEHFATAPIVRIKRELYVVREVRFTQEWSGRIEKQSMGNACVTLTAYENKPPTLRGGCGGQVVPWSEGIDREEAGYVHEMMEHAWVAWEARFGAPPYR